MKQTVLLIALIAISLSAERYIFNPSLYIPIPYSYQSLDFTPYFSLRSLSESSETDTVNFYSTRLDDNSNFDIYFSGSLNYTRNREDSLHQNFLNLYTLAGWRYNHDKYRDVSDNNYYRYSGSKQHEPFIEIRLQHDLSRYKNPREKFKRLFYTIELEHDAEHGKPAGMNSWYVTGNRSDTTLHIGESYKSSDTNYLLDHNLRIYNSDSKYAVSTIKPALNLTTGTGRINNVTYAATAAHSLYELAANNYSVKITENDVLALAELYERLKRERIFDTRESRIDHLDSITAWIESQGITDRVSTREAMELLDHWMYSFNQERRKGRSIEGGFRSNSTLKLIHETSESHHYSEDTTHSDTLTISKLLPYLEETTDFTAIDTFHLSNEHTAGPLLAFRYEKPTNLKGQLSLKTELFAGLHTINSSSSSTDYGVTGTALLDVNYAWYPSVRTTLSVGADIFYQKIYRNSSWNGGYLHYDNLDMNYSADISYYISPRVSINGTAQYEMLYSGFRETPNSYQKHLFRLNGNVSVNIF